MTCINIVCYARSVDYLPLRLERWLSVILGAVGDKDPVIVRRECCTGVSKEAANVSEMLGQSIDILQLQQSSHHIRVLTAEDQPA